MGLSSAQVLVESLITSFGLDFLIKDQHGGDVDTIHNVRRIGQDEQMTYKNSANQSAYENLEIYNSSKIESHTKAVMPSLPCEADLPKRE